jgi:hypothetical protein
MGSFLRLVQLDLCFYQLFIGSGFVLNATQRVAQSSSLHTTSSIRSSSQEREGHTLPQLILHGSHYQGDKSPILVVSVDHDMASTPNRKLVNDLRI